MTEVNGKNGKWITKENVIITLLLGIFALSGNNAIRVARIDQKVGDHIEWGATQNETTMNRIDNLEQMKHPATANRFTKHQAEIMDNSIKEWTRTNFVEK
jgi:hypothetical protein